MSEGSTPARAPRVAVIGGGLTGLVAAHRLAAQGAQTVLFEASGTTGGVIRSEREGAWLAEAGPNTLLDSAPAARSLLDELGLSTRVLRAGPSAKNRYIVRGGRPLPLPSGPAGFVFTRLFSLRAKLRLLREPFIRPAPADAEESLADFALRRLGREFLDYAVDPFVSGVYAGDPARLSVKAAFPKLQALEQAHGSLIRGALAKRNASAGPKGSILSFPEGLAELPATLTAGLGGRVRTGTPIAGVRRTASGHFRLIGPAPGLGEELWDTVALALPSSPLAEFRFEDEAADREPLPMSAAALSPHPPLASVFLGFRRDSVAHPLDGFGVLAPSVERRGILGVLFSSSLFPERAPQGAVALTVMIGGVRQPEKALLGDEALTALACTELNALLGVSGTPIHRRIHRWPRAIPQYTAAIHGLRRRAAEVEAAFPGLLIGGQAVDGVALGACIEAGEKLAGRALAQPISLP